jgi:hypothetical protein
VVHFFLRKIPRKILPPKMSGKIGIFLGKSFEKLFSQKIWRKIPRKKMSEKSAHLFSF